MLNDHRKDMRACLKGHFCMDLTTQHQDMFFSIWSEKVRM